MIEDNDLDVCASKTPGDKGDSAGAEDQLTNVIYYRDIERAAHQSIQPLAN